MKTFDEEYEPIKNAFLERVSSGSLSGAQDIWKKFETKLNINCKNSSGETALIIAARRNDLPMFSYLLDCGANPFAQEPVRKRTPQFYAKKHNNQEMLALIQETISNSTASISDSDSLSGNISKL